MAIKTTNAEEMNRAIIKKVERVLNNIEYGRNFRMTIKADIGSLPEINYQVDEVVAWESEDAHD